ncbi:MAG: thioesterase family protein [Deltaproteobacteria bacterium]|nr:thioesterase family protein [Deltaproteobacteria bacterium]MBW2447638.1 thioesterase family protein [Deltaproteobacteria bacterium]
MGDFEHDTRVRGGDGRYQATLSKDWEIWGPNGGYLASIALRAVGQEAKVARPASFYGHFLSVADFGDVDLEVVPVRIGRRSEAFRVSLTQAGKPVFEGMVRTAAEAQGLDHLDCSPPDLPHPETLKTWAEIAAEKGVERDGPSFPFWDNIEGRESDPSRVGRPREPGPPRLSEWYRFRPRATFDDPWVDAGRYVVIVDTLSWPAAVQPHFPTEFTAPSLDVMVWFHDVAPTEPWLMADHVAPIGHGGLMGTHGRVWTPDGRLCASGGSQLFCIPPRS